MCSCPPYGWRPCAGHCSVHLWRRSRPIHDLGVNLANEDVVRRRVDSWRQQEVRMSTYRSARFRSWGTCRHRRPRNKIIPFTARAAGANGCWHTHYIFVHRMAYTLMLYLLVYRSCRCIDHCVTVFSWWSLNNNNNNNNNNVSLIVCVFVIINGVL